jgi:ComF family protein
MANLPLTNYHHIPNNETEQRFVGRIPFFHATSFAYFIKDGLLQNLLHEFKYKNHTASGVFLAKRFAQSLLKTEWISQIDLIVPVPLHPKKLANRGFNQSEILARVLSTELGIPINNQVLLRVVNTESQTKKHRAQRVQNMEGAFKVIDELPLKGKHILLLDDVLTTGATIESCVEALKEVRDISLSIATIGIAMD